jgi:uncharacterized protein
MLMDKVEGKAAATAWGPVMLYVALAYGIGWVLWLPLVLGPSGLRVTRYDAYLPFFGSLGTVGPLIASFVAVRYETGRWGMPSRFFPTKRLWSWVNLLWGPVLVIAAFVVIPYMICIAPGHKLIALGFLAPLSAVWPNMLGGPLEEEFGWRGYLLPRLAGRMGNGWATVVVGVIWASWHLPLFLYRGWNGASFWYFLPEVMAVAVFASLAYFATGRSILGPIVVHYVFNTSSTMLDKAFYHLPRYGNRDVDAIILSCMVGVALLTIAVTRGRLGEARGGVRGSEYLREEI